MNSVLNLAAEWLGHEGRAANLAADCRRTAAHIERPLHPLTQAPRAIIGNWLLDVVSKLEIERHISSASLL